MATLHWKALIFALTNASNTTDFDFTRTQGFSIETWARTSNNDNNWKMLFGRRGPAGGTVVKAGHWQGEMGFGVRTSVGQGTEIWYTPAQPINDGQWHHWVFSLDATHVSIWKDGQKVQTAPHNLTGGDFAASTPFYVLRDTNEVNRWLGDVDEFAVYKGVLSQAEIIDHYNNGAGKYYASASEAPAVAQASVSDSKTVSYSPPTTALMEADQSPLMQTSTIASYTYDGDGRQVKAVVGSTTTYYIGAHYQVDNGVVTKYYFAGAQRVAMRKNGTLSYLLADHLGSTSLTTNTSGAIVSELRYKAWGETRYSSGTTPTSYRYTGQREEAGIGLYFYNARWYDPCIMQFNQPDTLIPDSYNTLDWNRYSYARYNPLRYTDPTGHTVDCGIGDNCEELHRQVLSKYNWRLNGRWKLNELDTIYGASRDISKKVDEILGDGVGDEWMKVYLKDVVFAHRGSGEPLVVSLAPDDYGVTIPWYASSVLKTAIFLPATFTERLVVHELAHVWDMNTATATLPTGAVGGVGDGLNTLVGGDIASKIFAPRYAPGSGSSTIPFNAQYPGPGNPYGNNSSSDYLAETFAYTVYPPSNVDVLGNAYPATSWIQYIMRGEVTYYP